MTPAQRTMVKYHRLLEQRRREKLFDDWLAQWPLAKQYLDAYDRHVAARRKR